MADPKGFFVTGTGTEVGKTLASLGLCLHFEADYWKPIQTGEPSDADFIRKFLPDSRVYPSSYAFKEPLSPNQSAEKENVTIDLKNIKKPESSFLITEGIGGVYVPLNDKNHLMDLIQLIGLPLIVVCDSRLGTLNHSLLTVSVLKDRGFKVAGLILSGPLHPENKRDIERWSHCSVLLEIPLLSEITEQKLKEVFKSFKEP